MNHKPKLEMAALFDNSVCVNLQDYRSAIQYMDNAEKAINDLSDFILKNMPNINPEYVKALASGTSYEIFGHMENAYKPINVGPEPKTFNINDR